jgi:plastocyanin
MRKLRLVVILAAAMALVLPSTAQASVLIKATSGDVFRPHKVSIAKGTKVVWKNTASFKHTVTSYSRNWSKNVTLTPGSTTSFTFKSAGTYKFRCTIHSTLTNGVCSGMCGKVVVG